MSCVVKSCNNYKTRRKEGISFYGFPKDDSIFDKWVEVLGFGNNWTRNRNRHICSIHFREEDVTRQNGGVGRKILKPYAVPSLFLDDNFDKDTTANNDNASRRTSETNSMYADGVPKIILPKLPELSSITPSNLSPTPTKNEIPVHILPKFSESSNVSNSPSNQCTVEITKDNFQGICRCCVVNRGEVNLFEVYFQDLAFTDMLFFCTNERILASDNLPRSICNECLQQIINTFSFVKKFKEVQVHIRELQNVFSGTSGDFSHSNDDIIQTYCSSQDEPIGHLKKPAAEESFKYKFRGLSKIYSQLCRVLLENKRELKRPIKRRKPLKFDEMVSEKVNENSNRIMEENTSNGHASIDTNPGTLPNGEINVSLEDELPVFSIFSLENNGKPYSKDLRNSKTGNICVGDENIETDDGFQETNELVKQKNYLYENEREIVPGTERIKTVVLETYGAALGNQPEQIDMYTLPDNVLEQNFEKIVKSGFADVEMDEDDQLVLVGTNTELNQCFECPQSFKMERDLIRHCRETGHVIPHRFKCKLCSATFGLRRKYKIHLQMHSYTKSICEICGAEITSRNLKRHMDIHNGYKNHICQYCGKDFTQKGSLDQHIKYAHLGETLKFLCFLCGKSFKTSNLLNIHLNNEHKDDNLGNKSYTCETCGKHFVTLKSLNRHETYNHGEQPPSRTRHKKAISTKILRNKHKQKTFYTKCPVCSKTLNSGGMKTHMMIHQGLRPHQCKICHRMFRQIHHLKAHMNLHLNEKPYECDICKKSFRHHYTLITHVRSHTGETPYICPVCNKGFAHSTSMKVHRRIHFKNPRVIRYRKQAKRAVLVNKEEADGDRDLNDCDSEKFDGSDGS